ncbi:hypothetical protein NHX12_012946 [Muraenolepis orangiensis]|uniref:BZIP domain-containing protein n=1 Tax=Muraenolepis orangiensis TaxID=630683 RepID=A0A9Q0DCY8_9TELE|nr:hypothetical protein NHX12_012946 [Muraenolepis orangiensis]
MITRRRGAVKRNEMQPLKVEVEDSVEVVDELPFLHEDDVDGTELELEGLFGIDDLKWSLDRDTPSSLFDIGLTNLGVYDMKDDDSMFEASTSPSPERNPYEAKSKKRENRSGSLINKNAVAARLNRLKKKEYVNALEKKVGFLSTENHTLRQENSGLSKRVEELEDETRQPTPMTTTTPYPGNASKWRRKRHLAASVCTWTRTTSQWSSALSVQRMQAQRSKCRVKYFIIVFRY